MRVIVVKAFGRYRVDDVIPEMPDNQAVALQRRGLVRVDQAAMRAPADRMMRKRITK